MHLTEHLILGKFLKFSVAEKRLLRKFHHCKDA